MAERIAAHPWELTELGARASWPAPLADAVAFCLGIRFPAAIQWGPRRWLFYNDAYAALIGDRHSDLLGCAAGEQADVMMPRMPIDLERVLLDGESLFGERDEWLLRRGDDFESRWYTWSASPLFDGARISGLLCLCIDDTAEVAADRARRVLAEERQLALDAARLGWFHYDPRADLMRWDARIAAIYQLDGSTGSMSRLIDRIHPGDRDAVLDLLAAVLDRRVEPPHMAEFRLLLDDGSERWITAHAIAEFDPDGRATRLVGTITDDTERKRAARELQRAHTRLELAQSAGGVGTYEFDPASGYVTGSEQFYRHFGLPADSARMTFDCWRSRVHPDDRDALVERIRSALAAGTRISGDYRVRLPDGRVRWLEYSGVLERDARQQVRNVVGTVIDVTARRETEQSLRETNQRLQLALDAGHLGDWRWSRLSDRITLSARTAAILGVATLRVIDRNELLHLIDPRHREQVCSAFRDAFSRRCDFSVDFRLERDGDAAWASLFGRCEIDERQRVVGIIGVAVDVTRQNREAEQLQHVAQRQQLLVDLNDRIRPLTDAGQIMAEVCELVGQRLNVSGCCYAEVDATGGLTLLSGYHAPDAAPERDPLQVHSEDMLARLREGHTLAIDDLAPPEVSGHLPDSTAMRALLVVPLVKAGNLAALFSLHHRNPHRWSDGERDLAAQVAERSWTLVERVRAEQQVHRLLDAEREARARAEQQSRLKDEFLATLSHELRTPLNAILGWVHLLANAPLTPEQVREGQQAIERNALAQAALVDDLLDMSRIVSGRMRLEPQRIDLCELIDSALTTVRTAADGKQIALQRDIPPDFDCSARLDPARMQQVLWNLLSNAIKFTPAGGRVCVELRGDAERVRISVSDTGDGMRADFVPQLFSLFRQADPSSTRRHGGLGIGLALVRQLTELHGGTVSASSEGAGRGSRFTVELPRRCDASAVPPLRPETDGMRGRADGSLAPGRLDGIRVLIVEDDPDTRRLLTALLAGLHADVVAAESADDGLEAISRSPPQVVVSDIAMPDCDGYEFMRRLRARDAGAGAAVPAIALTAFAGQSDVARALEAGYQVHLAKPVDPRKLVQAIDDLARRHAA